jgi:hypothetical protein
MGSSDSPRNLIEHAADAGLVAIREHLAGADAEVKEVLILLHATNLPKGELDTVSAGDGFEDARDLVAFMAGHFIGAARQVGLQVELVPVEKIGEG